MNGSLRTLVRLVGVELSYRRRSLLLNIPVILLYTPMVRLLWGPDVASGMPIAMIMIAGWEFVRRAAADDELTHSWYFLRALPLSPGMIAGVRHTCSLVALCIYTLVALGSAFLYPYAAWAVRPGAWTAVVAGGMGFAGLMMAGFNVLYYRFGYRALIAAVPYALIPYALAVLVVTSPLGRTRQALAMMAAVAGGVSWAVHHPVLAGVAGGTTLSCLLAAAWLHSAASLRRKELL